MQPKQKEDSIRCLAGYLGFCNRVQLTVNKQKEIKKVTVLLYGDLFLLKRRFKRLTFGVEDPRPSDGNNAIVMFLLGLHKWGNHIKSPQSQF